jgi:hypothetical protein
VIDQRISKAERGEAGERLFLIASLVRFPDVFALAKSGVICLIIARLTLPQIRKDLTGRVFSSLAVAARSVLMRESFRKKEVLHRPARRDRLQR